MLYELEIFINKFPDSSTIQNVYPLSSKGQTPSAVKHYALGVWPCLLVYW